MHRDDLSKNKQVALAEAGLRFLALLPSTSQRSTLVLKHFSQCTKVFEIWRAASPKAKAIFMYRDAIGLCNSHYGYAQRVGDFVAKFFEHRHFLWWIMSGNEPMTFYDGLIDLDSANLGFEDLAACSWGLQMQEFIAARAKGLEAMAFRYNELLADREGEVEKVFHHCGLDASKVKPALNAFDHDSHEGERSSRDKPVQKLDEVAYARIREILAKPKLALNPDLIL